jgi:ketosteroid isomerase-like protein
VDIPPLVTKELPVGQTENIQTIETIYDAFGRGDVATILEHVVDDPTGRLTAPPPRLPGTAGARRRTTWRASSLRSPARSR